MLEDKVVTFLSEAFSFLILDSTNVSIACRSI